MFSFNQRSQRYCNEEFAKLVLPPSIKDSKQALDVWAHAAAVTRTIYALLLDLGIPKEDARYILPHGMETQLVMAGNFRMFYEFIQKRWMPEAQWEIQEVARRIWAALNEHAPHVFGGLVTGSN
jgi:thymidylate synthase (FAD)